MKNDELADVNVESQNGMCLVDEQGLIIEWSLGQEAITGIGRMEALGRSIWDVEYQFLDKNTRSAEEYGRLKRVFTQILTTGLVPPNLRLIEIPLERSDGTCRNIQIMASSIKTAAGYMVSCLFRDVTAQNRMELALQEARAQAELANRAKGQFLARMSHEIRTPLHGITGLTELLSSTELTVEQQQYLSAIRSSADLLLQVVNDILDFSKIESGRLDLEETPFDLRELVERASDAVALQANAKGVELVVHLSPAKPTTLLGDPGRLQQVLVNLLNNAVKFTDKGQVLLRVRAESEQPERVALTFAVEDTGIGIAEEKQVLIFEAFRQSDGSTTRQYGGTGLGLSIAEALVELMGGQIHVESKLNRGSRFQFSLTFRKQAALDTLESGYRWHDVRVLIVDDNDAARLALEEILGTWGLQVITAENGEKGLQALRRARVEGRPIQLVLLDSTLPDNTGIAVATAMKAEWPDISSIMLLSSAQIHNEIKRSQQMGANAWLLKPIKYLDLRREIETILDTGPSEDKSTARGGQRRLSPADRFARGLRILLADDNQVGQVIGVWMLKQLGHIVETASNGQEVLAKVTAAEFDLILMDLEMPQMDGWQALRIIRRKEADSGGRRIPVLAVTADASKEIRDSAIQAGMDGYLPKPFKMDKLQVTLEPFLKLRESRACPPMFDHSIALEAVDGDNDILAEVVEIFLKQDYPRHLQNLVAAVDARDGELMRKAAHGLKGALVSFGASAAAATALQLQEMGARGEMELAREKLGELELEVEGFAACSANLVKGSRPEGNMTISQAT